MEVGKYHVTYGPYGYSSSRNHCSDLSSGFLLHKLGYQYINLDDCWAQGRFRNGEISRVASHIIRLKAAYTQ